MKKILILLFVALLAIAAFVGWSLYGPAVSAPEGKYFYIKNRSTFNEVQQALLNEKIIKSNFLV